MLRSVLHPGEFLKPGEYLAASNHLAHWILQRDGNVVLYRTSDGASLWSTGTFGKPIATASFQTDGNIVLRGPDGSVQWASGTENRGAVSLTLQDDGNLAMQGAHGEPLWDTGTNGFVGTRSGNKTSILTDAYAGISDAVDSAVALVNEIPGMAWATGLISDFAKTDLGKAFFRFVSPFAMPILWTIPFVGPVVASVAYALPGLARGEPLLTAYAAELRAMAAQVGQDIFRSEFADAVDEAEGIARQFGKLAGEFPLDKLKALSSFAENLGLPVSADLDQVTTALAHKLGGREDVARVAIDQVLGLPPLDDAALSLAYDPATGNARPKKTIGAAKLALAPKVRAYNLGAKLAAVKATTPVKNVSSAIKAIAMITKVTTAKATAAANLAHDVIMGRKGSEGYVAHLLNGGGGKNDDAAMASALAHTHAIQVLKLYVDKYTGGV